MTAPLPLVEWIQATKPHHATVASVRALPPGDHRFVCLDRNVYDTTFSAKTGSAQSFFVEGYWLVLRRGSDEAQPGRAAILCSWDDPPAFDRDLDIEWAPGCFYPLSAGQFVPQEPWEGIAEHAGKGWQEFGDAARLGWRGPMIPEAALASLPPVRSAR